MSEAHRAPGPDTHPHTHNNTHTSKDLPDHLPQRSIFSPESDDDTQTTQNITSLAGEGFCPIGFCPTPAEQSAGPSVVPAPGLSPVGGEGFWPTPAEQFSCSVTPAPRFSAPAATYGRHKKVKHGEKSPKSKNTPKPHALVKQYHHHKNGNSLLGGGGLHSYMKKTSTLHVNLEVANKAAAPATSAAAPTNSGQKGRDHTQVGDGSAVPVNAMPSNGEGFGGASHKPDKPCESRSQVRPGNTQVATETVGLVNASPLGDEGLGDGFRPADKTCKPGRTDESLSGSGYETVNPYGPLATNDKRKRKRTAAERSNKSSLHKAQVPPSKAGGAPSKVSPKVGVAPSKVTLTTPAWRKPEIIDLSNAKQGTAGNQGASDPPTAVAGDPRAPGVSKSKKVTPPPIVVKSVTNFATFRDKLSEATGGRFEADARGPSLQITTKTLEDHDKAQQALQALGLEFHTYRPKHLATVDVVIKGLPSFFTEEEIEAELRGLDFEPTSVHRFKSPKGADTTTVAISLTNKKESEGIFKVKYLLNMRVTVEAKRRKHLSLCTRCAAFGHTQNFCKNKAICSNCGRPRGEKNFECKYEATNCVTMIPPRCLRCAKAGRAEQETHNSISLQCPLYLEEVDKILERKAQAEGAKTKPQTPRFVEAPKPSGPSPWQTIPAVKPSSGPQQNGQANPPLVPKPATVPPPKTVTPTPQALDMQNLLGPGFIQSLLGPIIQEVKATIQALVAEAVQWLRDSLTSFGPQLASALKDALSSAIPAALTQNA